MKEEFQALAPEDSVEGDIASHSGRKCPAEYATNCGQPTNAVEIRGRWKGQKGGRIVFRYIRVQQLFEDADVAGTLCHGGPVMYAIKDGINALTTTWLFEHVVPNLRRRFPNDSRLCRVLALPLLYICLSSNQEVYVPSELRTKVQNAYAALGLDEEQPIRKVPLHIYRVNGVLMIDPVDTTAATGTTTGGTVVGGGGGIANEAAQQTVLVRMNRMEQTQTQYQVSTTTQLTELRSYVGSQFRIANNNIRAFGGTIQGSLVRQRASNRGHRLLAQFEGDEAPPMAEISPATLSNNIKTLMEFWHEYKYGINGRKAAEKFTNEQRTADRAIKQKYWRRNHVWQTMARLVRGGRTAERASLEIRRVYGHRISVTKIIEAMIRDKSRYPGGIHPNLL